MGRWHVTPTPCPRIVQRGANEVRAGIATAGARVACGPCTVVPSADLLLSAANPTVVAVPNTPSLIGAELYTQWLQLRPSGCPILPDFGFTNALKFTIAE